MVELTHFFHVYVDGNYRRAVKEHLRAMQNSGLNDALTSRKVGIVGTPPRREEAKRMLADFEIVAEADSGWEQVTLEKLREFAHENVGAIFYAHTKGATNTSHVAQPWRISMTHDTVTRWRECVEALETCDAAGPHWITSTQSEHARHKFFFGGNFWWATTDYLRRLPKLENEHRFQAEGWIGLADPKVKNMRPGEPELGNFARAHD